MRIKKARYIKSNIAELKREINRLRRVNTSLRKTIKEYGGETEAQFQKRLETYRFR